MDKKTTTSEDQLPPQYGASIIHIAARSDRAQPIIKIKMIFEGRLGQQL
jgi:hypothetical protein